jgi:hypothetical protein
MERTKELVIATPDGKVENKYMVEWPTIQQMIDIESMKLMLSKGKYTEMIITGTVWMQRALNYIDLIAYFSILCPGLVKDLKVDIRSLEVSDTHEGLLKAYQNQFLPWWNEYEKMIKKLDEPEEEKTSSDDKS